MYSPTWHSEMEPLDSGHPPRILSSCQVHIGTLLRAYSQQDHCKACLEYHTRNTQLQNHVRLEADLLLIMNEVNHLVGDLLTAGL